jgi:hypothetical protein
MANIAKWHINGANGIWQYGSGNNESRNISVMAAYQ